MLEGKAMDMDKVADNILKIIRAPVNMPFNTDSSDQLSVSSVSSSYERLRYTRIIIGIVIVVSLTIAYWFFSKTGFLTTIMDRAALQEYIVRLGIMGPVIVVVMMSGAIVFSPLPSAPIALAAGAAFGHTWGTIYILIGAEVGAVIAFSIARLLGHDILHRWFGRRLSLRLFGSQNTLMAIVFVTRLIPFISFDLVSYAAGLTSLSFWRFAIATLSGIIPASFLLAHFGGEVVSADAKRIMVSVVFLSVITLFPIAIRMILKRYRKDKENRSNF